MKEKKMYCNSGFEICLRKKIYCGKSWICVWEIIIVVIVGGRDLDGKIRREIGSIESLYLLGNGVMEGVSCRFMLFDVEVVVCLCMVWKCLCCELCKIIVVCIYIYESDVCWKYRLGNDWRG